MSSEEKYIREDYLDDGWFLDLEGGDLGFAVGGNLDGDSSFQQRRGSAGVADHSVFAVTELQEKHESKYGEIISCFKHDYRSVRG